MTSSFDDKKIKFERGKKFDIQLGAALVHERELAKLLETSRIEKIEAKHETWLWRRTGNICIEYRSRGAPSGIATTECDHWWHTLRDDDGKPMVHLVFPRERLLELARRAYKAKRIRVNAGDDGAQCVVLIPLTDILR